MKLTGKVEKSTQISLVQRVLEHLEAGTTDLAPSIMQNSVAAFTDSSRLREESEKLFRKQPLLACLSGRIAEPGDFITEDLVDVPVVLMRGEDGVARAFLNSCRHRGARVFDGEGTVRRAATCPYHGWTYSADGRLTSVPHDDAFAGLDKGRCGLTELPCTERHDLIWIGLSPEVAVEPSNALGGLASELASYGFNRYHHYATRLMTPAINWKMAIDTFLEPYHFAVLHRQTVASIFFPNLCLFDDFGSSFREYLPRRSIVEAKDRPKEEWDAVWHSAIVYYLPPNAIFVMQQDHAEVWRMFPRGGQASEAEVYLDFYIPEPAETESARRHWDANIDLTARTVEHEDFAINETAYAGFASGLSTEVIYGRNEPAVQAFHRKLAAMLNGG